MTRQIPSEEALSRAPSTPEATQWAARLSGTGEKHGGQSEEDRLIALSALVRENAELRSQRCPVLLTAPEAAQYAAQASGLGAALLSEAEAQENAAVCAPSWAQHRKGPGAGEWCG